jgi:hypothetical protein
MDDFRRAGGKHHTFATSGGKRCVLSLKYVMAWFARFSPEGQNPFAFRLLSEKQKRISPCPLCLERMNMSGRWEVELKVQRKSRN